MKALQTVGLMAALLTTAYFPGAQVLTQDVGIPLGSGWNTGTPIVVMSEAGQEGQITPIGTPAYFTPPGITAAMPGDVVFTSNLNPSGSPPSEWVADLRFSNPLDPTGVLGLPATETEAFFPADLGPAGFGSFNLMPDYNIVVGGFGGGAYNNTEVRFGPDGGINAGQEAIILFRDFPAAPAAGTPEPGSLALLMGAGVAGASLVNRRHRRVH